MRKRFSLLICRCFKIFSFRRFVILGFLAFLPLYLLCSLLSPLSSPPLPLSLYVSPPLLLLLRLLAAAQERSVKATLAATWGGLPAALWQRLERMHAATWSGLTATLAAPRHGEQCLPFET